jgi:hypothetical protein
MSTWLITGCSTGLGRALAEAVIAAGHNAVVTARDAGKVADLAEAKTDRVPTMPCLPRSRLHCPAPLTSPSKPRPPTGSRHECVLGMVSYQPGPTGTAEPGIWPGRPTSPTWTPTRPPPMPSSAGCNAHSSTMPASPHCGVPSSPHPSFWIRSRGVRVQQGVPAAGRGRPGIGASHHRRSPRTRPRGQSSRLRPRSSNSCCPACSTTTWARPATRPRPSPHPAPAANRLGHKLTDVERAVMLHAQGQPSARSAPSLT